MGRAHRVASRRDVVPTLATLVRDAASGRSPSTVVLTAGPGSGKSRVVEELVGQSAVPARVVAGGLGSTHEAYGVATRLVGVDLPEPVPADAPDRVLAGLDELAARGPQLLVVDDVQRVDAATLALLERVAGSARDLRLALVLTREPTPDRASLRSPPRSSDLRRCRTPCGGAGPGGGWRSSGTRTGTEDEMSGRVWTRAVAAVVVLWACSACGGGSSSTRVTLPKPPPTSRGSRSADGSNGLVGTCHLMSRRAFHTLVDRSRTVPCSRPHNVETAGVHPVYSRLTKANTKSTVQGYAGGCGPDYNSYLRIDDGVFVRLWGTPIATRRSDGSWVVRCDVYVGTAVGYGSRPAVTRTSLRAQAKKGDTGSWDICTDQPPGPQAPLVDCSRPHRYEGVPTYQAQVAVNRRYPSPAQLRARGQAVCRKAVAHRPDASSLVVTGTWTTKGQWVKQARPTNIYGSCTFSRADNGDLPPVR